MGNPSSLGLIIVQKCILTFLLYPTVLPSEAAGLCGLNGAAIRLQMRASVMESKDIASGTTVFDWA